MLLDAKETAPLDRATKCGTSLARLDSPAVHDWLADSPTD